MPAVALVSGGPVAANTTPQYTAQFVDASGVPIPASSFVTLTLSIVDKLTGVIINDCNKVNILNTGRGTVSNTGVVVVTLEMADTGLPETPQPQQIQRALIFDYTYNPGGVSVGRHEADFFVVNLAGP